MIYPPGYTIALTSDEINAKWPNVQLEVNARITSLKKRGFNCFGFAVGEENKDLDMVVFSKHFDLTKYGLSNTNLDHSVKGYAKLFQNFYHFEICDNPDLEEGFEKIALYEGYDEDGEKGFLHVALQLESGIWKSKLGWYEDIEHFTLDALTGTFYGSPSLYMKRRRGIAIRYFSKSEF